MSSNTSKQTPVNSIKSKTKITTNIQKSTSKESPASDEGQVSKADNVLKDKGRTGILKNSTMDKPRISDRKVTISDLEEQTTPDLPIQDLDSILKEKLDRFERQVFVIAGDGDSALAEFRQRVRRKRKTRLLPGANNLAESIMLQRDKQSCSQGSFNTISSSTSSCSIMTTQSAPPGGLSAHKDSATSSLPGSVPKENT